MGFRFSKRITLMPGVRVNLSKSGASLSVGPRGASVTMGKRGIYGNVGIPGTGLSYRERLDRPTGLPRSSSRRPELPARLIARVAQDGIEFLDGLERPIDSSLYAAARRLMKADVAELLSQHAAARNLDLDALVQLHHDVPWNVQRARPSAGKPERTSYTTQQDFMSALMTWRASQANAGVDWSQVEGDVLTALSILEWPRETNIALEMRDGRLLLDVDLPEIEDMPSTQWIAHNPSASLMEKSLPGKAIAALYLGHVSSLILRLIGHSFTINGAIRSVAVSAYTQRNGSSGRLTDEYVAVVEVDRDGWSQLDSSRMKAIDPEAALRRFNARLEINARGLLKIQQPIH